MKILNSYNYNFKGIKVTKKDSDASNANIRNSQKTAIETTEKHIVTLDKISSKININFPQTKQTSKNYEKNKADFLKRQNELIALAENIQKKAELAQAKLDADKEEEKIIENLDNSQALNKHRMAAHNNESEYRNNTKALDVIGGYEQEKQILYDEFISKIIREKQGEDTEVLSSILFFGPQGNGKTAMTIAVAEATESNLIKISPHIISQEDKLIENLQKIAENSEKQFKKDRTRTIIFIDELEMGINENSKRKDEFSEFIKTCSEKYHCSVFCATNHPLKLGLDLENEDIFPIRMSIDIPNHKNKLAVVVETAKATGNYDPNFDYEKIVEAIEDIENTQQAKYANGAIEELWRSYVKRLEQNKIAEKTTESFIEHLYYQVNSKEDIYLRPTITKKQEEQFKKEYDVLIGGNYED